MNKLQELVNNEEPLVRLTFDNEVFLDTKIKFENLKNITFNNCKFKHLVIDDCSVDNITFNSCEILNGYFLTCNSSKLKFINSKLSNVVFDNSLLKNTTLEDSLLLYTTFSKTNMLNMNCKANLNNCFLDNSKLADVDFNYSEIKDLSITNITCINVDLSNSRLISLRGDINSLKGSSVSMEQALDLIQNMGIEIK